MKLLNNGSRNFQKKNFVAVIFCLLLMSDFSLFAQKKFQIGIQFSPTVSFTHSVTDAYIPSREYFMLKPRVNFATGIIINYFPQKNIGLQSGIRLARKSYNIFQNKFAEDSVGGKTSHIPTIHAIEIPLLLIAKTNPLGKGYFIKALAGISFDWNSFDVYKTALSSSGFKPLEMIDSGGVMNSFGTTIFGQSIVAGIGIETPANFEIGLSYHYGITAMHTINTKSEVNKKIYQSLITPKMGYVGLNIIYYPQTKISYKKPLLYLLIIEGLIFSSVLF